MSEHAVGSSREGLEKKELEEIFSTLQKMACHLLRYESLSYLWSPASLVNEAYIRIAKRYGKDWVRHPHTLALWHRAMRNALIDGGRASRAHKRNIGKTLTLTSIGPLRNNVDVDLSLALTRVLQRMSDRGAREALVIHLRFVEGLSINETAETLRISTRTAKRALREARSQISAELPIGPLAP